MSRFVVKNSAFSEIFARADDSERNALVLRRNLKNRDLAFLYDVEKKSCVAFAENHGASGVRLNGMFQTGGHSDLPYFYFFPFRRELQSVSPIDFLPWADTVLAMSIDTGSLKLTADPFENFLRWMADAEAAKVPEPTAMTLATASGAGVPSARIVLYKGLGLRPDGVRGFRLFTNYDSHKSKDLQSNPRAALVFFWAPLGRQIRVEGRVEKLNEAESDEYFASRPRGSRIGAWASPQSQKIKTREELLQRVREIEKRFPNESVARPANWGGWLLVPDLIEFWQAGEFRLHDRFVFESVASGDWRLSRLAP
jgi:pyridoxamine 5'-phosphate oxidase